MEYLETGSNISLAAKKAGISRATIYRWLKSNRDFQGHCERAIELGYLARNDVMETNLFKIAGEGKSFPATKFYLERNHPRYMPKVTPLEQPLTAQERREYEELKKKNKPIPKEHMERIIKAMKNWGLVAPDPPSDNPPPSSKTDQEC